MAAVVFENQKDWYTKTKISKKALKTTILRIAQEHKFHVEQISIIVLSDKKIREINVAFLNHDYFTDVITFDLSTEPKTLMGEVYISKDSIINNAVHYKCTTEIEFVRVALHGTLHLCGYKDKTANQKKIMRNKENLFLDYYMQTRDNN